MTAGAPGAVDQGLFANLHAYVQINPALAPIAERLQLKRLVPMAVDQAIVEIITPVVERSVTIACMTAQELIVKVLPALLSPAVPHSFNGRSKLLAQAPSCTHAHTLLFIPLSQTHAWLLHSLLPVWKACCHVFAILLCLVHGT